MRIRKRQVPFALSDPLPNLNDHCSSSPVVQQLLHPKPSNPHQTPPVGHVHPQPSDHPNRLLHSPIGAATYGSDFSQEHKNENSFSETLKGEETDGSRDHQGDEKGIDTRKGSILGAHTKSGFRSESSSSSRGVLGRWFEGEKAFPLKKRRGSFGEATRMEKDKEFMKSSDSQQSDDKKQGDKQVAKEGFDHNVENVTGPKKRARGNEIMEGSRCSRVNGRGWRCCQQTLVGYSLCEHHLGKGRLRSLNSVRSRSLTSSVGSVVTVTKNLSATSSLSLLNEDESKPDTLLDVNHIGEDHRGGHVNDEEKKPLMVTKKRMKLGVVKARSMSSLLGQTNSASVSESAAAVEENDHIK